MATQFLRKIILEELQKVLKEADYPDIPGSQPGQDMSYMPSGPSGMTKRSPLPGEKDFMGPAKTSSARRVGDPKVKKLQNILASVGYDVGKIDGVPGKLLFKAISDANKDMSGVGVPPERVAKDFMSSGPMAADEFISMFSDPQQLAALRKANVKKEVDKATAGVDKALRGSDTGVTKPVKPEPSMPGSKPAPGGSQFPPSIPTQNKMMPSGKYSPKEGDKMKGELGTEVYHNGEWIPESEYQQLQKGLEEAISREIRKLLRKI